MNAMCKLTIITINYNNLKGLQDTFKSVFEQTWQDFEYIVIDGGSTDGSRELIEKNSDKIDYWVSEKDKGIYNALNKGIVKANGEYILCLNSGDSLCDVMVLEKVIPMLTSGEDIIYGNIYLTNSTSCKELRYPINPTWSYLKEKGLGHPATFIKNSLHKTVGLYDESLKIVSDWKFMLLAIAKLNARSKYLNIFIANFDDGGISTTNSELRIQERERVLKSEFEFYISKHEINSSKNEKINIKKSVKKVIKLILPYGLVVFLMSKKKN